MRFGVLAAAVGGLLVASCGARTVEVRPPWPAAAVSGIAVVRAPDGLRVAAVEQGAFRYEVLAADDVQVFLLTYSVPLLSLGLTEGPLALAPEGAPSVGLPRPEAVLAADSGSAGFMARDGLPADLTELRIATSGPAACGEAGGCFAPRSADEVLVCRTPCPPLDAPAPPAPPAAPRVACPEGWPRVGAAGPDDVDECAPFAEALACAPGTIQIPGAEVCRRVGARCPDGEWPSEIAAGDRVSYVRRGAPAGGDGSPSRPLGDVADVSRRPGERVVVVLGPGRHDPVVAPSDDVVFQGVCVGQTEIRSLEVGEGAQVELRDLDYTGANLGVAGSVRAVGVRFGARLGLRVLAPFTATDCAFESGAGAALEVREGGRAEVRRSRLSGGLVVRGPTATASVADAVVTAASTGIEVYAAGQVGLSRVLVADSRLNGAYVEGAGSRLEIADAVFSAGPGRDARLLARDAGEIEADRIVVAGASGVALSVLAANLMVRDGVVRDTVPERSTDEQGIPVQVLEGGTASLTRVHLARGRTAGLVAANEGTRITAQDVRVVDIAGEVSSGGEAGHGVYVVNESKLEVERLLVQRPHGLGVLVTGDAWVDGSDLWVQDVLPRDSNQAFGRGIEVGGLALFDMQRVRVERAKNIGFHVLDFGSRAVVFDLVVSGTERSACFEFSCNAGIADGLTVNLQASAEIQRFRIEDNEQFGLRVINESPVVLRDGLIRGNAVGAQVIDDDFDARDIVTTVRYEDNTETFSFLAD